MKAIAHKKSSDIWHGAMTPMFSALICSWDLPTRIAECGNCLSAECSLPMLNPECRMRNAECLLLNAEYFVSAKLLG
jgi:hypothetical protein